MRQVNAARPWSLTTRQGERHPKRGRAIDYIIPESLDDDKFHPACLAAIREAIGTAIDRHHDLGGTACLR